MVVFIDGIDKTGKDTLVRYVNEVTNYEHTVLTRGPLSSLTYARKFNRNFNESHLQDMSKCCMIVLLTADIEDLNVRFKLTQEPEIDKEQDLKLFNNTAEYLVTKYGFTIVVFNTSARTPYQIALDIKNILQTKEGIKQDA